MCRKSCPILQISYMYEIQIFVQRQYRESSKFSVFSDYICTQISTDKSVYYEPMYTG